MSEPKWEDTEELTPSWDDTLDITQPDIGMTESALRGLVSGATFGFADELPIKHTNKHYKNLGKHIKLLKKLILPYLLVQK